MYSTDMPLTMGSLGVPPEPDPWRMSRASRRSAQVRIPEEFVSCMPMKRIVWKGASRCRKSGWNGENESPGCHRWPAKCCPCQSGIQTWKSRTGSVGLVASIRR